MGIHLVLVTYQEVLKERQTEEIGDFLAMVQIMVDTGMIYQTEVVNAKHKKIAKLEKWSTIYK